MNLDVLSLYRNDGELWCTLVWSTVVEGDLMAVVVFLWKFKIKTLDLRQNPQICLMWKYVAFTDQTLKAREYTSQSNIERL